MGLADGRYWWLVGAPPPVRPVRWGPRSCQHQAQAAAVS
jgi:hypothetical protein